MLMKREMGKVTMIRRTEMTVRNTGMSRVLQSDIVDRLAVRDCDIDSLASLGRLDRLERLRQSYSLNSLNDMVWTVLIVWTVSMALSGKF